MLTLTRSWYARPIVKQHPHVARALMMTREYILMVALFLIIACWTYPVFHALDTIYDFDPSFVVRFCLVGFVFLVISYLRHWVLVYTSDPIPVDTNGRPIPLERGNFDPNLVFERHNGWRTYIICWHGAWGAWVIALSITAVYSLVIAQLALWRLLLEAQEDPTPMTKIATVAVTGALVFMVLHLIHTCYSMSRAIAGAIGQIKIPLEERTIKVWSGLLHAGSYLV